ncbi:hypothetical protein U9J36_13795 [Salmonella enterica]|nr:hypothetical protein [Salmonella enterica]WRP09317.1 hypothetical protein U9J36_13795 [Salmonella enterica]
MTVHDAMSKRKRLIGQFHLFIKPASAGFLLLQGGRMNDCPRRYTRKKAAYRSVSSLHKTRQCKLAGFLSMENPQLGWGFRKAFSFKPVIKTPFDLLKHLAVWQLQKFNKKSKGGPNGGRKELSAHPMEL